MLRKSMTLLFILVSISCLGCKRDAEVSSTLRELDVFTMQLVQTVDGAQGAPHGLDAAQQIIVTKGENIRKKMTSIRALRGYQISDGTKDLLTNNLKRNISLVAGLQMRYMARSVRDPNYKARLEKLLNDYKNLLIT